MTSRIIIADSVDGLRQLPGGCVQLVVCSPPYDQLRRYKNAEGWDFAGTAEQLKRVLCNGGIICWNVNNSVVKGSETNTAERQKIHFTETLKLRCLDTMFYGKKNFSHPEKVRYHQVVEYIYVFSNGRPRVFNPIKDKRNSTAGNIGNLGANSFANLDGSRSYRPKKVTAEWGMRHNLWIGKTRGQEDMCEVMPRTAMMPRWLARDLIRSFSNPGDTVLDCMAGSGTTGMEALKLNRSCILIEKDPEALPIIERFLSSVQPEMLVQ